MSVNIKNIKKIILVAAGKGGVGKTTISASLALNLSLSGLKVGLLDADIYGPSIPSIFGLNDRVLETINNMFVPLNYRGIKTNSIGYLVKEDSALAWRGPMITKSLNQLLFSTDWGDLDYLIVDMPPGTGDIHLTFAKTCPIDGAVIVTTPDKLSEKDVSRAIDLYKKLNIPILGIVENMSYLEIDGKQMEIFGKGAMERIIDKHKIEKFIKLPILPSLSEKIDVMDSSSLVKLLDL